MRPKSEAGTTWVRIIQDVRVEKEILTENSTDQTGDNKEMQRLERMERMNVRTTKPKSTWENKTENVIETIKVKSKRIRV